MNESGYVESRYHPSDTVFRGSALGEIGVNADGNKFLRLSLITADIFREPGKNRRLYSAAERRQSVAPGASPG